MEKFGNNTEFLSLKEYEVLAKKVIHKYLSKRMVENPNILHNVINSLILADSKFNGSGDRFQYMIYCAKFQIKTEKRKFAIAQKKKKAKSNLDIAINDLMSTKPKSLDYVEANDIIEYILNSSNFSHLEKIVAKKLYVENAFEKDIARDMKISQQYVNRAKQSLISKLRRKFNDESK